MSGTSDWTDIPNSNIDQDSPATETLFTAIRDNINAAQWNYYDDSTGLVYNFSSDGAVTNVVCPDFEDGYDYLFIYSIDLTASGTADAALEIYWENEAAYTTIDSNIVNSGTAGAVYTEILFPRIGIGVFGGTRSSVSRSSSSGTDKIKNVRFLVSGGQTFTGGRIIMCRRHNNL